MKALTPVYTDTLAASCHSSSEETHGAGAQGQGDEIRHETASKEFWL